MVNLKWSFSNEFSVALKDLKSIPYWYYNDVTDMWQLLNLEAQIYFRKLDTGYSKMFSGLMLNILMLEQIVDEYNGVATFTVDIDASLDVGEYDMEIRVASTEPCWEGKCIVTRQAIIYLDNGIVQTPDDTNNVIIVSGSSGGGSGGSGGSGDD